MIHSRYNTSHIKSSNFWTKWFYFQPLLKLPSSSRLVNLLLTLCNHRGAFWPVLLWDGAWQLPPGSAPTRSTHCAGGWWWLRASLTSTEAPSTPSGKSSTARDSQSSSEASAPTCSQGWPELECSPAMISFIASSTDEVANSKANWKGRAEMRKPVSSIHKDLFFFLPENRKVELLEGIQTPCK